MCGICGICGEEDTSSVELMNAAMRHRGPDDSGTYLDGAAKVALGARRLAVIDVEGGHQPLSNEDGSIWAVLNGELYNHPALRESLARRGHRFATRTDTEVLVHLYEEHGEALVHALEGMFAFAIWDEKRRKLLVARDRFGEKPLFYSQRARGLAFASELTALLASEQVTPELDPAAVDDLFVFGYVRAPRAMVTGVRQLEPASTLSWDPETGTRLARYWYPPSEPESMPASREEIVEETEALLRGAIRSRMISDVPLGVFLSGGMDSTLVAALAAQESSEQIKTFSVGYDVGSVNETERSRVVAERLGTDHHELRLDSDAVARRVPALLAAIDQPLADGSLVAAHALSDFARERVTVAVGGEGADELFGGYPRYRWLARAEALGDRIPAKAARPMSRLIARTTAGRVRRLADVLEPLSTCERQVRWVAEGRDGLRSRVYGPLLRSRAQAEINTQLTSRGSRTVPGRLMRLDQAEWLPDDVLAKADRASMLASLELRTPFLHVGLAELAASIPADIHVAGRGKAILRSVLSERLGLDPPRRKTAFRVPSSEWLKDPLRDLMEAQVREGSLVEEGWFDRDALAGLLAEHAAGRDRSKALWPILTLGVWADRHLRT